jgi:hypothetical protein
MPVDDVLKRAEGITDYFLGRRARAAARLEAVQDRGWHFSLLGLKTNVERFEFAPGVYLQSVVEPPGEVALAGALRDPRLFGAVGRYSSAIQHELVVVCPEGEDECSQQAFNLAYWLISALRVRSLAEILVPVVADHSWSCIAGITDQSCRAQFIEDVPRARRLDEVVEVTLLHLEWVREYLGDFDRLGAEPRFRLAVHAFCNHNHTDDTRIMAATLWSGIEALFGIQHELRFRLAAFVAAVLEPRGEARRDLYKRLKRMYDIRSKAVHGSQMEAADLDAHVLETRRLVSRLLCAFTEAQRVYTEQEIEDLLFC